MPRVLIVSILLLLACADHALARSVEGMVRKVYDGDTVMLVTRESSRFKVRLYGVDAPETAGRGRAGQPYGAVAKRTLMYKILGRKVTADIIEIDQYQRAVAVIRYAGRDINLELVAEGMAWAYRHYLQGAYASEYIGAESRAISRRAGLWRDSNPQPPWEYRQLYAGKKRHGRIQ